MAAKTAKKSKKIANSKKTSSSFTKDSIPAHKSSSVPANVTSQMKNPFSPDGKLRNLQFDKLSFSSNKRVSLPIVAVVILLVLGYIANRYLVIAWVDNRPITRLEYYHDLAAKYGKDEREQLIVENLIESEATKKGITVSDQEVNSQIAQIEAQQGGASQLDQVLQMQNLTRQDLNKLVKLQIMRQKLFGAGLNISDDEINQYIEQNKTSLPEIKANDASGEAQLRDNIRQQLLQQKVSATFSAWLQTTSNSSRVIRVQP